MIATINDDPKNSFNNLLNDGRVIYGIDHVIKLINEHKLDIYEKVNPCLVFYYSSVNDIVLKLEFESHYERRAFEKLV